MAIPPHLSLLSLCRDPLFLIDSKLNILWENEAALALKARLGKQLPGGVLAEICHGLSREHVLGTHGFGAYPVTIEAQNTPSDSANRPISGTAHIAHALLFEVSGAEPDQVRHLVSIQASAPPSARSAQMPDSFATIAHDLKNPLSAIFGYADALLDSPSGKNLSEREQGIIGRIRGAAARCIEMVRNYQQLAEIETGIISRRSVTSDLNTLARAVVEHTWREDSQAPKLNLKLSSDALPVAIEPIQLERIISNLFVNALRYTAPRGTVTIETGRMENAPYLRIHNTGSYIPPDEISKIFGRYQRGSTSVGTVGTGLGLYIVEQLVSRNNGSIHCLSSKDTGTEFIVRFPG